MKKENVEVSKLVLKVNDKEIELSLAEAKELKNILSEIFNEKIVKETEYVSIPNWQWNPQPYIYRSPYWTITYDVPNTKIYCSNNTNRGIKNAIYDAVGRSSI